MNGAAPARAFFVINSLEGGGAERVFATLVDKLSACLPMAIELVLLDRFQEKYAVPPAIRRHQLDCMQRFGSSILQLTQLARQERPDLLFSFLTRSNCAAVIAGMFTNVPVIISERVHTTSHFGAGAGALLNKLVVRSLYPRASHIIAASHGVANDLLDNYGASSAKTSVIYNPIQRDQIMQRAQEPLPCALPERTWLAIGRLTPNKNFGMLIEAFARAEVDGDLVILGEGPERGNLMKQAQAFGIGGRFHLPGHVDNPYACLRHAHAYLSSSNAEGFPNALVEALVVGKPVAATDCDSGPSEILRGAMAPKVTAMFEAEHGLLVPPGDAGAMAQAIAALADTAIHGRYAGKAARRAGDFDLSRTIEQYAEAIGQVMQQRYRS